MSSRVAELHVEFPIPTPDPTHPSTRGWSGVWEALPARPEGCAAWGEEKERCPAKAGRYICWGGHRGAMGSELRGWNGP